MVLSVTRNVAPLLSRTFVLLVITIDALPEPNPPGIGTPGGGSHDVVPVTVSSKWTMLLPAARPLKVSVSLSETSASARPWPVAIAVTAMRPVASAPEKLADPAKAPPGKPFQSSVTPPWPALLAAEVLETSPSVSWTQPSGCMSAMPHTLVLPAVRYTACAGVGVSNEPHARAIEPAAKSIEVRLKRMHIS